MSQIKPNQVIPASTDVFYPNFSLPRDLVNTGKRVWASGDQGADFSPLPGEVVEGQSPTSQQPSDSSGASITPNAPLIQSIKSQTVSFKPDGTATIDVVLVVEDIDNVVEYDIRIAKNGNL